MKRIFYLAILSLFLFACGDDKSAKPTSSNTKPLEGYDWLIGEWNRTNDEEGKSTFEHWKKSASGNLSGLGFTLQNGDTIFKENLAIIDTGGDIFLEVTGVNPKPTRFLITEKSDFSFSAQNPINEFPKTIAYTLAEQKLYALVSNEETEISFSFEKVK